MRSRADRGSVRIRLTSETVCVARVQWWAEGRMVGQRRLRGRETDLSLPEGRWTLQVTDDRASHDRRRLAPARVEVDVRAGAHVTTDVTLVRGAVLSGFVSHPEPRLARFSTVTATAADGRTFSVRTDGLGSYTLAGLPSTGLLLRGTQGSRRSAAVLVEPRAGQDAQLDLVLTQEHAPGARSGAELLVGAAFTGRVADPETGAAAYAAVVELRDARGTLLARTRADRTGRFVVGGDLPASSGLTVVVRSGPDRITVDERRLRGLGCREAQLVDLGEVGLPRVAQRPRPARASLPRASAAAMSLPATRV